MIIRYIKELWEKKYLEVLIGVAIIGSLLLVCLSSSSLNDVLLFITLIVLIWYSRETMDLKKISNKQSDRMRIEHKTNLKPYLRLQKGGERNLIIVNEGRGVAVNLRPVYKSAEISREFLRIPAMSAAPNSSTKSFVPIGHGLELDPSVEKFIIEVAYNDIEKRNYIAIFQSNPLFNDGFEILEQKEQ